MSRRPPVLSVAAVAAALALLSSFAVAAEDVVRLTHQVDPVSESLHLTLDADKPDYSGTAKIALRVNRSVGGFRFHARELTLDKVTLTGKSGAVAVTFEKPRPDMVEVKTARPLAPGAYTLTLAFHNKFNTRAAALYRMQTGGHGYLFTQFESTEAREAFPCWDEPEFKIPWDITLRVPAKHLAIANTLILRTAPAAGGMKDVTFKRTRPLPSYLIAIATGPLETVEIKGMSVPGRIVTIQGASALAGEAARITPLILKALEDYFGRPYPYDKLDQIAAPEFLYGAMENAGAVIYADRTILADPNALDPGLRSRMAGIIAHELAHMWFGDLVTMKWWDDLWLNESFANWMGTRVVDKVFPEFNDGLRSLEGKQRAMNTDGRLSTRAMRQPITAAENLDQAADELAYNKGEAVLDMFESWLGPDVFRSGVLAYLKAHEWGNATASDLFGALSRASGQDITGAMSSFLDQPGVPLVNCETLPGGTLRLSQRRCLDAGLTESKPVHWRIPLVIAYGDGLDRRTKKVWLGDSTVMLDLELGSNANWVTPNAEASGYYRWQVPMATLEELSLRETILMTPRERIGYILNLPALLRAGVLHGPDVLSFVRRFSDDPEPQVTAAMMRVLEELRDPLVGEASRPGFAAYLRQTLGPGLERIGRVPRRDEAPAVGLMRPDLLRALGDAGQDADVIAFADSLRKAYLQDPGSVDPALLEPAITLSAIHGDRALFDEYRKRFENSKTPAERGLFLTALGAFRDTTLVEAALNYSMTGPLRPQEKFFVPRALGFYEPNRDRLLAWIKSFYPTVAGFLPPHFAIRFAGFGGGCSEARYEDARQFFLEANHAVPGMAQELDKVGDRVHECLRLSDREASRTAAYLSAFTLGQ